MRRLLALLAAVCFATPLVGCSKALHTVTKGPWNSAATMVSVTSAEERSYLWNGTLSGQVDQDGNISLNASNGCNLKGVAEPKFGRWSGPLQASGCSAEPMNTAYDAVITYERSRLVRTAKSVVLGTTATVVSEVRAEMQLPDTDPANL